MKTGILITSRNNYSLLKEWHGLLNNPEQEILSIDEDSTEEQKELGKEICSDLGITYIEREERGMLFNVITACDYFEKKGIEWILYSHTDCYPLTENFWQRIENYISDGKLDEYGVVGFNVLHGPEDLRQWNGDDTPVRTIARTPLEPGDNWYRHIDRGHPTRYVHPEGEKRPFVVESVMWSAAMINIKQYKKYIIPTGDYQFHMSWDDIAFQFLYNNIYNVVLPQFTFNHDQERKVKHGIPKSSPSEGKDREHYSGKWGHNQVWKERWGFEFANPESRIEFEQVKDAYEGTLLVDFYNHDPINGPMKFLDF